MYLDGKFIGTLDGPRRAIPVANVKMTVNYLGIAKWDQWPSSNGTYGLFNGAIDEFQIYDTYMTETQIATLIGFSQITISPPTKPDLNMTSMLITIGVFLIIAIIGLSIWKIINGNGKSATRRQERQKQTQEENERSAYRNQEERQRAEKERSEQESRNKQQRRQEQNYSNNESDPFSILEVPKNATKDEVMDAYRKLALKYHPDRCAHKDPITQELYA